MNIRSLNNATIHIESDGYSLLIDPWLLGDLYGGAWSPASKLKDLNFLNSVNYIFISHIHEDHWDLDTINLVPRSAKIFLPKMPVNKIIEKRLKEYGFESIELIDLNEDICISQNLTLKIIAPLNTFGQEIAQYIEGYEYDLTNIDTSILIIDKNSKSSHLFLCDNTPYDLQRLVENINIELTTLWYPFNGYSQDYPVCYKNLSQSEKGRIHNEMQKNRINATIAAINKLKPKYCLPHSSDFVVNGPALAEFKKYTQNCFINRAETSKIYGKYIQKNITKSDFLDSGDVMNVRDGLISIKRNVYDWSKTEPAPLLHELKTQTYEDMQYALADSIHKMLERIMRLKVDISGAKDWVIVFKTESIEAIFCFNERKLHTNQSINIDGRNILQIYLTDKILSALIDREMHWNNAMIGFHLRFIRTPNEYCQPIYKALNFLHS